MLQVKMIKISRLFCIFLLYSCSSYNYQNIAGSYTSIQSPHHISSKNLILHGDSTFTYTEKAAMYQSTISGKWELRKSNLYFVIKQDTSFYLIYPCDTCEANRINIYDAKTKEKLGYAQVQMYSDSLLKEEYFTDKNGFATFEKKSFDIIRIHYIGYDSVSIGYHDNSINNICVFLAESKDISYMLNSRWRLTSDKKIKQVGGYMLIRQ